MVVDYQRCIKYASILLETSWPYKPLLSIISLNMSINKKRVYFLIPAYNEGSAIKKVLSTVLERYPNVVCVDDGSRDDTSLQVEKTKAQLVKHTVNLGQGAALQTAIEYALLDKEAQYFVTFDADGQHSLSDVETMLKTIDQKNLDIVLGSRFLGKAQNIKRIKKYVLKAAILFTNKTSGLKLTDTHNGLRVFNRHVAETLKITMPDFAHASEIIERIAQNKYLYKEVPVTITYTDYSTGKGQSVINAVNVVFDVLLSKVER